MKLINQSYYWVYHSGKWKIGQYWKTKYKSWWYFCGDTIQYDESEIKEIGQQCK